MNTTQDKVMARIRRRFGGDGAVVTPRDFLDLASRDAIDQAMGRLVGNGDLRRVGRGLYHLARINPTLGVAVPPDADKVADAIGRQTGCRVAPSPAVTANRMGLSTQIPAKPVYITTGRSRTVRVGGQTIRLKHVAPSKLLDTDSPVSRVLQALRACGPNPDETVISTLRKMLSTKDRVMLVDQARSTSGWVIDAAKRVATPRSINEEHPILG